MTSNTTKIMTNLTIYILVFTIVIFGSSFLVLYFNSNIKNLNANVTANSDYDMLNLYLLKTVNTQNVSIKSYGLVDNEDISSYYITFLKEDGTTSTFIKVGNIIYFNKIKLCENVERFKVIVDKSEKESVSIEVKILGKVYNSRYALN